MSQKENSVLSDYRKWCKETDEDWQYDEIHVFFENQSRGALQEFMELAIEKLGCKAKEVSVEQPTRHPRPLYEIANEIKRVWSKQGTGVNYAAKPYLEAMQTLNSINDNYYEDSGQSVVVYFLSNAQSFRGEDAKRLKAELKKIAGIK